MSERYPDPRIRGNQHPATSSEPDPSIQIDSNEAAVNFLAEIIVSEEVLARIERKALKPWTVQRPGVWGIVGRWAILLAIGLTAAWCVYSSYKDNHRSTVFSRVYPALRGARKNPCRLVRAFRQGVLEIR